MSETTSIAWTDSTFNPFIGCTKVSPGCDNCYAERDFAQRRKVVVWGPGQSRKRTSAANWALPLRWERQHAEFEREHGRRRRVFCASLADVFDNEVPDEWRRDLFSLIERTPHLDWQLLTKRIGNATDMMFLAREGHLPLLPNAWIGATVVNQAEADRDIPKLLCTPAAVRFLSIEPMLGPIDLTRIRQPLAGDSFTEGNVLAHKSTLDRGAARAAIDWVIVGGESGPKARPFDIRWARSIVQQCQATSVPVFVKQIGEQPRGWCASRVHISDEDNADLEDDYCDFYEAHEQGSPCPGRCGALVDRKGGDPAEWPKDLRVREFPRV